ncbi:MAG: CAP domain-containing protein [Pseudomonadota bacterium]
MTPELPPVEIAIVEMTNAFRKANQRSALKRNKKLDEAAAKFATFLAHEDKFDHRADGKTPRKRIAATGYTACAVGENLSLNSDTRGFTPRRLARAAIEGWKKSNGHRRTMLLPYVTEIGVGVAKQSNRQRYFSVQVFARPKALEVDFSVRNTTDDKIAFKYANTTLDVKPNAVANFTVCVAKPLVFPEIAGQSKSRHARFIPADGDTISLTRSSRGALSARQIPRTQ